MSDELSRYRLPVVTATGEEPRFQAGDQVRILTRQPVGHYRVPIYVRGKTAVIDGVLRPAALDNEEEGFGRNAGLKRHYYRVIIPLPQLWADYAGAPSDTLAIEVYETWLELVTPHE